jgi:hypothetical protein
MSRYGIQIAILLLDNIPEERPCDMASFSRTALSFCPQKCTNPICLVLMLALRETNNKLILALASANETEKDF